MAGLRGSLRGSVRGPGQRVGDRETISVHRRSVFRPRPQGVGRFCLASPATSPRILAWTCFSKEVV